MENSDDKKARYVEALQSEHCFCRLPKAPGYAFCRNCYVALPFNMRSALLKRIGRGFEQAYDDAKNYLLKF